MWWLTLLIVVSVAVGGLAYEVGRVVELKRQTNEFTDKAVLYSQLADLYRISAETFRIAPDFGATEALRYQQAEMLKHHKEFTSTRSSN